MDTIKKVPKRRFKGFTDAWEQRKLEEVFNKIRNAFVGTATPYYVTRGNFYLESNNIKNGEINRNTEVFINDDFYLKQKDKWLKTNDLVMVQSGHVGHTAVIPPELNNSAAHALIMFQDYKQKSDANFINYQFQIDNSKKKLSVITTGNTIKHILASDMKKFRLSFPSIEEQTKIGNFFKQLDETITLQERKLNKLINMKKAYLEEMFPAEGESKPRRRFEGFTDDWKECELRDVIISELKGKAKAQMYGGKSIYLDASYLNGGITLFVDSSSNVELDDVLILWDGSKAGTVYHGFEGALGSTLKSYKPKYSGEFLYQYLKKNQQKIYDSYRTANIPHVIKTFTQEFIISIPGELEQVKIGSFFKQLDESITLQEQKLTKLKQLKSAYLEEMFV